MIIPRGDRNTTESGALALGYWRETETRASIAFPISYADSGLICATHKRRDGGFNVTALASDSGMFPFDVTLDHVCCWWNLGRSLWVS